MENKKRLIVTIDTEMDADIHWKKREPMAFSSVVEGIPCLLRPIWDAYSINPIYFVSPEVVEDPACCAVLKAEIARGAVIGAHLHPEYIEPERHSPNEVAAECFPCFGCDTDLEREKLRNLKRLIETKLGVTPIWYRAARFGADADTYGILEELGFRHDSSQTPGIDWSVKGGPNHRDCAPESARIPGTGLYEHPVTICGKRWGILGRLLPDNWLFYRWLRPTHMTCWEQKRLLRELNRSGRTELVMMFHSMEPMVNKTPYVRTGWMQRYYLWRLRETIAYARKLGYSTYELEDEI